MACGTPVVAFARGAANEVVLDGETGFLVHDVEGMMRAVNRVDRIDPRRCRRHVEEKFSAQRMTEGYLATYERILEEAAVGEALSVVAPGPPRASLLLTAASQLAEAASSTPEEGSTDEALRQTQDEERRGLKRGQPGWRMQASQAEASAKLDSAPEAGGPSASKGCASSCWTACPTWRVQYPASGTRGQRPSS
jgi:hypothetical protein